MLRLGRAGGPELARLEIRDPALIAAIDELADSLDRTGTTERRAAQARDRLDARRHRIAGAGRGLRPAGAGRPARPADPAVGRAAARHRHRPQVRAMLDTRQLRQAVRMRHGRRREARPRRARQADRPAGDRGRPADPAQDRGGPPARGQRHCIAGRTHLRLRGADHASRAAPTNSPASSRTRSAMSPTATAPARCCRPPACRFCSACCSAISPAAAWW